MLINIKDMPRNNTTSATVAIIANVVMDVSRRAINYMSKPVRIIILLLVFLVQSIPYYSTLYLKEQYHYDGGRSTYAKPTFECHICDELFIVGTDVGLFTRGNVCT